MLSLFALQTVNMSANGKLRNLFLVVKLLVLTIALTTPVLAQLVVSLPQPYATRGIAYSSQAVAIAGTAPYTFAITMGALPPGLKMDPSGAVSGTPTQAGNFTFTISATDANNLTGSGSASISVAGTTLALSPASIVQGHVGVAYSPVTFTVSGGVPPYAVSLTNTPPAGMTFNLSVLSGTPTVANTYSLNFLLTDQAGDTTELGYTLPVTDIQPATISGGVLGVAYSAGVSAVGFGGVSPTLSVGSGTLPPGVTFSSVSNLLSGTPNHGGNLYFYDPRGRRVADGRSGVHHYHFVFRTHHHPG
jgi:hypothetical protein